MQFPAFLILVASAATGLAQNCTYASPKVLGAKCAVGNNLGLFCTGLSRLCTGGKKDTFDETATKDNELACVAEQ
ncbi:hypothetical protein DHEL01_v212927 [Diaporthe helianthi]|uniref:Uncharacterized protein n=1 Tax=Diaporthe helianthi TaxID=158607 RepID=A0A2P5HEM3_DIAHE|nr:hypothetical protein DHEL01_v212927 [Diaporthe helianthi]